MPDSDADSDASDSSSIGSTSSADSDASDTSSSSSAGSSSSSSADSNAGSSKRASENEAADVEQVEKPTTVKKVTTKDTIKQKSDKEEEAHREEQQKQRQPVDNKTNAKNVADTSKLKEEEAAPAAAKPEKPVETETTTNPVESKAQTELPTEQIEQQPAGKEQKDEELEEKRPQQEQLNPVTTNGNGAREEPAATGNSPSNVEEGEITDKDDDVPPVDATATTNADSNKKDKQQEQLKATTTEEEEAEAAVRQPPQIASQVRRRSHSRSREKLAEERRRGRPATTRSRSHSRSRSPSRRRRRRTRSPRVSRSVSPVRRRSSSLERRRVERQKRHDERDKRDEERAREREKRHQHRRREPSAGAEAAAGTGAAAKSSSPAENADNATVSEPAAKISERQRRTVDLLTSRTGGAYIPPAKLRLMQAEITDKASAAYQRIAWEALKKSIHGYINKVNVTNIAIITRELLRENIVRGRGLLCRSIIQAQAASPTFTHVYAALVAIINSKFPNIGELLLKRLVIQFRRAFRRNDKMVCMSATRFIGHLVNQRVAHEILALEMLTLLVEMPTDDSVEVAIAFLKECGMKLTEVSSKGIGAIFEMLRNILHEGKLDRRVQYMIEVLFQVRKDGFKDHPAIVDDLELVEEDDQFTHLMMLDEATETEDILNIYKN
ncbi:pre-mRNA-splicing factor CWC22 homolog isoform X2 [Drosophila novamexicana]|uniref:pre-mRNA-splicing factor CWC22 homolog isoform X2 n=1 Tax=Drosophila novamexicana TaxID=47314 RepID=UPI0011E5CFFB|nr:pre-mRNA-splicing factor CWC22 homolog isoform X2 [Drosophila novamexicana]